MKNGRVRFTGSGAGQSVGQVSRRARTSSRHLGLSASSPSAYGFARAKSPSRQRDQDEEARAYAWSIPSGEPVFSQRAR